MNEIIKLEHISKEFPGVKALNDITTSFEKGKVNVLLGENGAGKSTLIKILSGIYTCDQGKIIYMGEEIHWKDAKDALNHGISVIHQELSVINDLSVAENVFLGKEIKKYGFVDMKSMEKATQKLLDYLHLKMNPKAKVKDLSSAEKQMVELARALSNDAEVVIMDEPTSSLTNTEVDTLFDVIKELKKKDVCIIYISHRMSEIKAIGDTVTILKDGTFVDKVQASETDEKQWIKLMVGRDIRNIDRGGKTSITDEIALEVKNITNGDSCKNVSFQLRKGEILGIAGLVGAGRTEVLRAIFGADPKGEGEVYIYGKKVDLSTTAKAVKQGIALVPEDRRGQGVMIEKNIVDNIALPNLYKWTKNKLVDDKKAIEETKNYIKKLEIKVAALKTPVKSMSGGNQQKVVLSKWLAADSRILFMDEPTRGIDVNAKNEIYKLMVNFVEAGGSIVMVSSELPEILGISDRILVMREGEAVALLNRDEASEETILSLASI